MTAEREAMTLERQAFEKWARGIRLDVRKSKDGVYSYADTILARAGWKAAIAHLSRAAEPLGWAKYFGDEEIRVSWSREPPEFGKGGWWPIYTHPPESARDAEKLRALIETWRIRSENNHAQHERTNTGFNVDWESYGRAEALSDCADELEAAMAQESGDE